MSSLRYFGTVPSRELKLPNTLCHGLGARAIHFTRQIRAHCNAFITRRGQTNYTLQVIVDHLAERPEHVIKIGRFCPI